MQPKQEKYDVGIIIARFQVNKLHVVHKELIDYVLSKHKKVIVILGDAPALTKKNPLDVPCRTVMLKNSYPELFIGSVKDNKDDKIWSKKLDEEISKFVTPVQTAVLYGGRGSFIPYYTGNYPTVELEGISDAISGTQIREDCKVECLGTTDFNQGIIYDRINSRPAIVPTVDIAVLKDDCLVLGQKASDKGKLRFIGGFAEISSLSYEVDAKREVQEELGCEVSVTGYIGSININDWRYTPDTNMTIRTSFYAAQYLWGGIKAADDICYCEEIKLVDLKENMFVPEHVPLFNMFKEWATKKGLMV